MGERSIDGLPGPREGPPVRVARIRYAQIPERLLVSPASPLALRLYGLLDLLADARVPFPGRKHLAGVMGVSESTVDRAVDDLKRRGFLHVTQQSPGEMPIYEICPEGSPF